MIIVWAPSTHWSGENIWGLSEQVNFTWYLLLARLLVKYKLSTAFKLKVASINIKEPSTIYPKLCHLVCTWCETISKITEHRAIQMYWILYFLQFFFCKTHTVIFINSIVYIWPLIKKYLIYIYELEYIRNSKQDFTKLAGLWPISQWGYRLCNCQISFCQEEFICCRLDHYLC